MILDRTLPGRPAPYRLRPRDLIVFAVRWAKHNRTPEA